MERVSIIVIIALISFKRPLGCLQKVTGPMYGTPSFHAVVSFPCQAAIHKVFGDILFIFS